MELKIAVTNPTRRSVTVTIPATDVAAAEKEVVRSFMREASLPGYRPGKAPEPVVRGKYGKAIADELSQRLLSKGYARIGEEKSFTLYGLTDVHRDDAASGQDVVIRYEVDIVPDFKTPDWKSVRVPEETVTVTDGDVEEHLTKLREQRARYEKTDEAAAKGDYVRVSYSGLIDGKPVSEIDPESKTFGHAQSTWEEAGAEGEIVAVPAVTKALVGLKAGDKTEAVHAFPADHEREALRGKQAAFAIEALEVRRKTIPALNEEFFKSVGVADEAELRAQLRKGVEGSRRQAAERARREKAVDALLAGLDFPLPESAVDAVARELFYEFAQLRMRSGTTPDQLEGQREEILAEARKAAAVRVRAQFVLTRVAEEAKIEVSREELSAAVMRAAYAAQMQPEKLIEDRQRLAGIRRDLLLNKALDAVLAAGDASKVEKA
ncbi:MAG: trigger factor [Opitutales bacterium]